MDLNFILVILFYFSLIILVYLNKDKFQIYAKIIALYRTHAGLKSMVWLSKRFPRTIKFLGYTGIFVGYLGMIYISSVLIGGAYSLLVNPNAQSVITPVLPGIKIPGSPVFIPFWYGIISIFLVAVIHEFSHGVVSTVHGIKVKNSGIVFFGPIIGAFVEPDEKELRKADYKKQLSIFGAGPFSNVLSAIIVILFLSYLLVPFINTLFVNDGMIIQTVTPESPIDLAGIKSEYIIRELDGVEVLDVNSFSESLLKHSPGDKVSISDGSKSFDVNLGENPENKSVPYLGITHIPNFKLSDLTLSTYGSFLPWTFVYLKEFLVIFFILSLGIGLANLLPLGPADGGRILQLTLFKLFDSKKSVKLWKSITSLFVFLLLFNLFFPYLRYIF